MLKDELYSKDEVSKKVNEVKSIDNDTIDFVIDFLEKEAMKKQNEFLTLNDEKSMFKLQGNINALKYVSKELVNLKKLKDKVLRNSFDD